MEMTVMEFGEWHLRIVRGNEGITEIAFTGEACAGSGDVLLQEACFQMRGYLAGTRHSFSLPLCIGGTAFQKDIFLALCRIPYAAAVTYGQVAEMAGHPGAARAAGQACGANRLAVAVPCHRVVASGGLGGYAYGLRLKQYLLELERRHACGLCS